ncbi:MAG: T9SS type A sorting domain-containing protein [Bacteroidetes bacterium]|nr:T9SS type A sorting domain-containing protein [Bacteroidota bacterium]
MNSNSTILKKFTSSIGLLMILVLTVIFTMPVSVFSQEGVVSNAVNNQINPASTTDSSGGTIVTWQDYRNGKYEIYAQRINASGLAVWTPNGVPICLQDSNYNPAITYDGIGGAIITWQSYRNSATADIYAQRIDSNGVVQWTANGVALCVVVFDQNTITMVNDDNGGAILTWRDYRSNIGLADIYAQRVSPTGAMLWVANGVSICNQAAEQGAPKLISDGTGGAFITWSDNRAGDYDIYTQRISAGGAPQWTTNGVATCTSASDQLTPSICSDGAAGVIITWSDFRSTTDFNIYAQRQGPAGGIVWTVDGIVMNNNVAYAQTEPQIISDELGGAIITWTDYRTGVLADIYAQRVSSTGAVQWTATGVTICTAANDQIKSQLVSDGNHGAYIAWEDHRNAGNSDIYVQRIASDASLNWSANGVAVCDANYDQLNPSIVSNGNNGALVVWQDFRGGNDFDIVTYGFNTALPVELASLTSIVNNRDVNLKWTTVSEINNSGFEIERKNYSATNDNWVNAGFVAGNGTVNTLSEYNFQDQNLQTGKYNYRLKQIDYNGNYEYHNLSSFVQIGTPSKFNLSQNYPNPFNPVTKINFEIPIDAMVNITVFDMAGREVKTLVNETKSAGFYTVQFDASGISSGLYFYRIMTDGNDKFIMTKKLIVIK